MNSTTYETDFNLWLEEQATALKQKNFSQIDIDNLVEEIEGMAKSDKRALKSQLIRILEHLLKIRYQPKKQQNSDSWVSSIFEGQLEIFSIIEDSPSLKGFPLECLQKAYETARRRSSRDTKIEVEAFPQQCPWTIKEVLGE